MAKNAKLVDKKNLKISSPTYVTPQTPKNLGDLTKTEGVFSALLALPLPTPGAFYTAAAYAVQSAVSATGALNRQWLGKEARELASKLQFQTARKVAGPNLSFDVTALERNNGTIDFAIKATIIYTTGYTRDGSEDWDPFSSLYQDIVSFGVAPKDAGLLTADPKGISPDNQLSEVNYSNEVSWGANGGFSAGADGPGGNGGADASWTVGSSTAKKDFNLTRDSDLDTDGIGWVSQMQNVYDDGHNGHPYHVAAPVVGLSINGVYTKWLKIPPPVSRGDYDLEFLATYKDGEASLKNKQVVFQFHTSQRLMHVEVNHRWGAKGGRLGGVISGVPYWVHVNGEIVVDISRGTATATAKTSGQNLQQFINAVNEQAIVAG